MTQGLKTSTASCEPKDNAPTQLGKVGLMALHSRKKNQTGRTGITHFPLSKEQESQKRVPSPAESKGKGTAKPGVGGRGQRLSRKAAPQIRPSTRDGRFATKAAKGGKTGSRAGLLSANRKVAKKRK